MKENLKNIVAASLIILLLPYVITVIFTGKIGREREEEIENQPMVILETKGSVERIGLEDYLVGVLASQISPICEPETLKVQALISRTGIVKILGEKKEIEAAELGQTYYSLEKLEKLWGYENYTDYYELYKKAVRETKGKIVLYQGQLPELPFHAVSAGSTRTGKEAFGSEEFLYLTSVDSSSDKESENYLKIVTFSEQEILDSFKENGLSTGELSEDQELLEILTRDSADYVTQIRIGNITISGEEFREGLHLNSSCFTIGQTDGKTRIVTRGLGHGVGLSQYGANKMASEGKSYDEILKYYFSGIEISSGK